MDYPKPVWEPAELMEQKEETEGTRGRTARAGHRGMAGFSRRLNRQISQE